MVLNRRLPHAMFCPSLRSDMVPALNVPTNLTHVETFPGAACLKRFAVIHAPTQIARVPGTRSKAAPLQARH